MKIFDENQYFLLPKLDFLKKNFEWIFIFAHFWCFYPDGLILNHFSKSYFLPFLYKNDDFHCFKKVTKEHQRVECKNQNHKKQPKATKYHENINFLTAGTINQKN